MVFKVSFVTPDYECVFLKTPKDARAKCDDPLHTGSRQEGVTDYFLGFLASEAGRYPAFRLIRRTEARDLIEADGRVAGVRAEGPEPVEMRLHLKAGERLISETWAYRYDPEAAGTVL